MFADFFAGRVLTTKRSGLALQSDLASQPVSELASQRVEGGDGFAGLLLMLRMSAKLISGGFEGCDDSMSGDGFPAWRLYGEVDLTCRCGLERCAGLSRSSFLAMGEYPVQRRHFA